ncbi:hypothetical protein ABR759_00500 [Escherichia coli]
MINVRGYSDDYEFEEDRVALEQQGRGGEALCQTVGVLASVLGADVLLNGNCVQGLLAFSALAYDDNTHRTTIHPLRDRNLAVYQRGFFNVFPSRQEMLTFSQIDAVAQTIKKIRSQRSVRILSKVINIKFVRLWINTYRYLKSN